MVVDLTLPGVSASVHHFAVHKELSMEVFLNQHTRFRLYPNRCRNSLYTTDDPPWYATVLDQAGTPAHEVGIAVDVGDGAGADVGGVLLLELDDDVDLDGGGVEDGGEDVGGEDGGLGGPPVKEALIAAS